MLNLNDYYQENCWQQTIEKLKQKIALEPNDLERRSLSAELFCSTGNLMAADKQLANITPSILQEPAALLLEISLLRNLIKCALYRQNLLQDNTLPNFIAEPPLHLTLHLEGFIALYNNDLKKAQQLLREAEQERPVLTGKYNNHNFCYFRDLDDLTVSFLEIFMPSGKYYWIPLETIEYLQFLPPSRPLELIWRKAELQTSFYQCSQVYIPTTYNTWYNTCIEEESPIWKTNWKQYNNFLTLGNGQKIFLFDEKACTVMELNTLQVTGKS